MQNSLRYTNNPTGTKDRADHFLAGKWHDKAKAFRILTSHPIEDTKIGDAIETAAKSLEALDITFEVIGQERLSEWLKDHPRIVDDFFSRAWVEEFCGPEAVKQLTRRMNADKVAEYRVRLKKFYQMIFNRHDPGIPVPTRIGQDELQLRDRFIVPEVYGSLPTAAIAREIQKQSVGPEASSSKESGASSTQVRESPSVGEIKVRVDVDRWLSQGKRSVILGGPEAGRARS